MNSNFEAVKTVGTGSSFECYRAPECRLRKANEAFERHPDEGRLFAECLVDGSPRIAIQFSPHGDGESFYEVRRLGHIVGFCMRLYLTI